MRRALISILLFAVFLPGAALAQSTIAGVVKDTSGGVLPGVTVEASSPALIEKTRSVVSDGTGQYRIVDLRPGTYSVIFTLPGFNSLKRDGVELSGTFVATVNAEMKVGAIEETITVTSQTPVVDIQSAKQQSVISKDVLDAIPTGRSHNQIVGLVPGISVAAQDVGGSGGVQTPGSGQIHGSTTQDGRLQTDGLSVGFNGSSSNMYMSNASAAREVVVSTSGGLGEADTGGVVVNIVPRDGGNTFSGTVFANYAGSSFASNNYTSDLMNAGLPVPNTIKNVYDFNPMFGGPVVKNRLWFFATSRTVGANNYIPLFTNANAGNPAAFTYVPTTTQALTDNKIITGTIRLTATAGRSRFTGYFDYQKRCVGCTGAGGVTASGTPDHIARSDPDAKHVAVVRRTRDVATAAHEQAAPRSRLRHVPTALGQPPTHRRHVQSGDGEPSRAVYGRLCDQRRHCRPLVQSANHLFVQLDRSAELARVDVVRNRFA